MGVEVVGVVLAAIVSIALQVAVVILGVVIAFRWLSSGRLARFVAPPPTKDATEIVEELYARGLIDGAELDERRSKLRT